ncbi:type IV pilus biogenesis protein PilP [Klebsiella michiganensis]|uniref:Type IV pilus biogenesis protein PilP n=1 Tax=Klebsiella michiganensis TaxID=1134687 RepID=A0A7H4M4T6_9ENTR|nr:type IV pilus biogenesis protein PilP [Klebsiella michiganensis]
MRLKWWCWLLFPLPLLAEERDPFQPPGGPLPDGAA